MKKLSILLACFMMLVMFSPALAKGPNGPAGMSNMSHWNLMPADGFEGSWGKVTFNHIGETMSFVLNAKNLEPDTDYVIKSKGEILGEGTTNPAGNLHINGEWDCNEVGSLEDGRINVRRESDNERILWTGDDVFDVFKCESVE